LLRPSNHLITIIRPLDSSQVIYLRSEAINYGEGEVSQELEDARWFTREEAKEAVAASLPNDSWLKSTTIRLPPPFAIAHQLVKAWTMENKHNL